MPDLVGLAGDLIGGLLGFAGDAVGTAVGAVMSLVGSMVEGLATVADALVDQLPDAGDLGLSVPSGWIYGYSIVNTFLPLTEALAFAVVIGAAFVALGVWRLGVTVYHLIPKPFIGT